MLAVALVLSAGSGTRHSPATTAVAPAAVTPALPEGAAGSSAKWIVCRGLRYFSCQTPSRAWKVAETAGGIQVTLATDAAYVGFAVDPNTDPALVAHDIDATLATLGIIVTHS